MVRIGKGNPILFVLILSFFVLSFTSCGLPQNPVYVRGEYEITVVGSDSDPISILLNFDGEHIYGGNDYIDGLNIYYNYSHKERITETNQFNYEYFLCYNTTGDRSEKPLVQLNYDSNVMAPLSFEFYFNDNTAIIYNKELYQNKNIDLSLYDEDDIINFTDEKGDVFINFFIEYYVKRENDDVSDSTDRVYINSYKVGET